MSIRYTDRLTGPGRPWRTVEQVELATLEWVRWFNNARLHNQLGQVPPAEYEAAYYAAHEPSRTPASALATP